MPSITTWTRLEPRCRREDMRASLEARLHDPLWLLGRQWQLGELRGTDGGSPVVARFRAECARLSRYRPGLAGDGAAAARAYDPARTPLEALVESEPARKGGGPDLRLAAEAGLHFLRLLSDEGAAGATREAYIGAFPLEPPAADAELDDATRRYGAVMAHRVPDGARLHAPLREARRPAGGGPPGLPDRPRIDDATEAGRVARAADAWLALYDALFTEPVGSETAWIAERLEYAFAVAARTSAGEIVLGAKEHPGGRLDWPSFAVETGASLGAPEAAERVVAAGIPAPVGFRGMPAARWWELEDAQVDLGAIEAEPEDLLRLLMVEFAVLYGNDWFLLPVELPVGTVCRAGSLVVIDSFGQATLVRPSAETDAPAAWRMFHVAPGVFVLPPSVAGSLHGAPVEDVVLLRDEMANMAWAVERLVESPAGGARSRFEAYHAERERERERPAPQAGESDAVPALAYRIVSQLPPPYWIPLVPEKVERRSVRLRRGRVLGADGKSTARAQGRILEPQRPLWLYEEEVPRAGARVIRWYRLVRWSDGSTHVWAGRLKQPGRGEGSSGQRFDVAETPTPAVGPS